MGERDVLAARLKSAFVSQPQPKFTAKDLWLGSGMRKGGLSIYSYKGKRIEPVEILPLPGADKDDKFDLSKWLPGVGNQLADECTAAATSPLITFIHCKDLKSQGKVGVPERNTFDDDWIYSEGRKLANMPSNKPGLRIGDAMELFRKVGVKPERAKSSDADKIANHKIEVYARVNWTKSDEVKIAIKQFGPLPASMWIGASWFNSLGYIEEGDWGKLHHSVLVVGWSKENGKEYWIIRNSWGSKWAQGGYAYMVPRYLERYTTDCVSIVDIMGSKDLYPANNWEKWLSKQPQWFKDAFQINF
ncbi:hypothetical protein JW977_02480 [Candidatus Falkowbacteria bacterium]|nr:hypothetical protein [Candidatus Falkowbacteria bacterium]